MRIALKLAYNGLNYHGFARQPKIETVEKRIINILKKHEIINELENSNLRYASRTDRQVSAIANVIAFDTNNYDNILDIIHEDYEDIVFYGIKLVDDDFNPRFAEKRIYRYYYKLENLDLIYLKNIVKIFIGKHNFSNYARLELNKNPVKIIDDIKIREREEYILIDFYAQSFLWHQIRRIISAVDKVIENKIDIDDIKNSLKYPSEKIDYGLATAKNLVLLDIKYNFNFQYYKKAIKHLKNLESKIINNIKYPFY